MLKGLFTVALVALGNTLPCHGSSSNRDSVLWEAGSRPGFGNCTIEWFEQPLDHFNGKAGARSSVTTFKQRVCIYDNFRKPGDESPTMLFYTGNESPVDLYVNNTGIMWTLGVELSAVLVFAEHRYFGDSIPELQGVENCMSYLTSTQALADFAVLVPELKTRLAIKEEAPVVAFGGSYGGMLATWFRIKYPNVCNAGAVAGSAPIWGFASTKAPLDGAFQAISLGAETPEGQFSEQCQDSFLASWLVLKELMADASGRDLASDILRTCQPIRKGDEAQVLAALQDVLFLLAESNFPFPSDYIVFSVINKRGYALPAWPMRQVCKRVSRTQDEVHLVGNRKAVQYKLEIGKGKSGSKVAYDIDWDKALPIGEHVEDRLDFLKTDQLVHDMIAAVRDVYSMIYNITGEYECFDLSPYDGNVTKTVTNAPVRDEAGKRCSVDTVLPLDGWGAIVCNEGMVMVQDTARGIGNDMYWPPNVGRGEATQNYTKLVVESNKLGYCAGMASKGLQGVTSDPYLQDPLATWLKAEYGGHEIHKYASNIIFSNGRYDPWSQAGVLESQSASLEAIVLEHGGHHSDFMFDNIDDPDSLREARNKEMEIIKGWIQPPLVPKQGPRTISVTVAVILIISSVLVVEFARSRYVAFRSRTSTTEDTSHGDYTRI